MEGSQFDFLSELVPAPQKGKAMTREQKLDWLAEQTPRHCLCQVDRQGLLQKRPPEASATQSLAEIR